MNGKRIATNDNITKKSYMTAYQSDMKQKSKVAYILLRRYGMLLTKTLLFGNNERCNTCNRNQQNREPY